MAKLQTHTDRLAARDAAKANAREAHAAATIDAQRVQGVADRAREQAERDAERAYAVGVESEWQNAASAWQSQIDPRVAALVNGTGDPRALASEITAVFSALDSMLRDATGSSIPSSWIAISVASAKVATDPTAIDWIAGVDRFSFTVIGAPFMNPAEALAKLLRSGAGPAVVADGLTTLVVAVEKAMAGYAGKVDRAADRFAALRAGSPAGVSAALAEIDRQQRDALNARSAAAGAAARAGWSVHRAGT